MWVLQRTEHNSEFIAQATQRWGQRYGNITRRWEEQLLLRSGVRSRVGLVGQARYATPSHSSPHRLSWYLQDAALVDNHSIRSMLKVPEKNDSTQTYSRCLLWSAIPFNLQRTNFIPTVERLTFVGRVQAPRYEGVERSTSGWKADCTRRLGGASRSWT